MNELCNFPSKSIDRMGNSVYYKKCTNKENNMEVLNKKELTRVVSEQHNLTKKESAEIVDLLFDTMSVALQDGAKVDIAGFGKFEVKTRAARTGINPQTKEPIQIPATKIPGFKASKSLKDMVR